MMKKLLKNYLKMGITLLFFITIFGCATKEVVKEVIVEKIVEVPGKAVEVQMENNNVPLTPLILKRICDGSFDNFKKEVLMDRQFKLSHSIELELEDDDKSHRLENGVTVFVGKRTKKKINMEAGLDGIIQAVGRRDGKLLIGVCFEENDSLLLEFEAKEDNDYQLFNIRINKNKMVNYGGSKYSINYGSHEVPYLIILLREEESKEPLEKNASGRKVSRS